jgi:hypothetical protein
METIIYIFAVLAALIAVAWLLDENDRELED